jgi:putative sigma-54 modulation protein
VSGADLFASDEHENMYSAIENMVSKLDRPIIKHKEKLTDHQAAGSDLKHSFN